MKHIIFVCHGNICRSPMAEYIFKHLVHLHDCEAEYTVSSAAVSAEESGNDIYPKAKQKLHEYCIPFSQHHAHQITPEEYALADCIVVMDNDNIKRLQRITGDISKVTLMRSWINEHQNVEDPWYTGRFETVYRQIRQSCEAMLDAKCNINKIQQSSSNK